MLNQKEWYFIFKRSSRKNRCTSIILSDYIVNNNACLTATALGTSTIESHFTDKKDRSSLYIVCSINHKELSELIEGSKEKNYTVRCKRKFLYK